MGAVLHRAGDLQRAAGDSVADILARQPGVQFTDNGGRQTPTGIMLRGANANRTGSLAWANANSGRFIGAMLDAIVEASAKHLPPSAGGS